MKQTISIVFALVAIMIPFLGWGNQVCNISGQFEKPEDLQVKLRYDSYYLGEDLIELNSPVNESKFTINPAISKPYLAEIIFFGKAYQLYLEPDAELYLQIPTNDSASLTKILYSKELGEENNFWQDYRIKFEDEKSEAEIEELYKGSSVDKLEIYLYDRKKKQLEFLNSYSQKNEFSTNFLAFVNWYIKYDYINKLLSFSVEKAKTNTAKNITPLPRIITESIDNSYIQNDDQLFNPKHREFLDLYVYYKSLEDNKFIKFDNMTASCEAKYVSSSKDLTKKGHNYFLANFLYNNCDKISAPVIIRYQKLLALQGEAYYSELIKKHCGDVIKTYDPIAEAEQEKKNNDKKKEASQPFELTDEKGNKVYLSDFKGKLVYVDFWASWCGPCRGQMKAVPALKEKLGQKYLDQMVFLYISIDDNETNWKKGIESNEVHGVNVLSPGGWKSQVCKHFNLNSIPRYMIMDKDGVFVNTNAKRPSEADLLIEELKKYLK